MSYVRGVTARQLVECAGISWQKVPRSFADAGRAKWRLVTWVASREVAIKDSKLLKSVRSEVDDSGKRSSLLMMLSSLSYAVLSDDYQAALKEGPVDVKVAHTFKHGSQKLKVWELKYGKKDRLYFFTFDSSASVPPKLIVLLFFHHKKDQNTPDEVKEAAEKIMRPFFDPRSQIKFCLESP